MQKKKLSIFISLVILACVLLSGCKPKNTYIYEGDSYIIISLKSVEETPIEEIAFTLMGKIKNATGYVITGTGETKASISKQNISAKTVKSGNEYYFYSASTGFVSSFHQAFFWDGKVVYGDSGKLNKLSANNVCSKDEYSGVYGFTPEDELLCGYTINKETVTDTTALSRDGNRYTFRFTLDGEKASNKMKIQMQTFGGLNGYPEFEELYITAVVYNDWTVEKIIIESEYKISKKGLIGTISCSQRTENAFTEFNRQPVIENADEFRNKLK